MLTLCNRYSTALRKFNKAAQVFSMPRRIWGTSVQQFAVSDRICFTQLPAQHTPKMKSAAQLAALLT
jgi:hypothetical protein